jgi:GntR family transcriptional regulator, arabinose operon transcriptional repressor
MGTLDVQSGLAKRIQYDYLESKHSAVGSKLPTVLQLAQRYNVSPPTIRKATERLVKLGWLTKRRGSGIYIEALPESSHTKIGYISTDFRSPLDGHILEGINHIATKNDCGLVIASTQGDVAEERLQVETMQKREVDGVIVYCTAARGRNSRQDYLAGEFRSYPVVITDLYSPRMSRPHVIMDNCYAGYEMTQYLLSKHRRHIAFIKFDKMTCRSLEDRFMGYRKALEEANISLVPEHVISYDFPMSNGNGTKSPMKKIAKQLISTSPRPDAIIVPNDYYVPDVINFLRSCSISVPEDVIVAGFDNIHSNLTDDIWPTTKPDFVKMGEQAAEMLLERITSKDLTPSGMILPCPLLLSEEQQETESTVHSNRQFAESLVKA